MARAPLRFVPLGLLLSTLAACSQPGVSRFELESWEGRYQPAPSCTLVVARGAKVTGSNGMARTGASRHAPLMT